MGSAVSNFQQVMVFDSSSNLPQTFNELSAMLRLDIVEAFVADEVFDLIQPIQRCASPDQLVQNREHLLLDHGAAFQQDLAHCQNLAAGEEAGKRVIQQIAALCGVV